jgi:hypothetical protein
MTDDGQEPRIGDTAAIGCPLAEVGGPAGVPDAGPAPHHHLTFLAAHSGLAGPGYRQRLDGASPPPARQSRIIRVPARTRAAKGVPMA